MGDGGVPLIVPPRVLIEPDRPAERSPAGTMRRRGSVGIWEYEGRNEDASPNKARSIPRRGARQMRSWSARIFIQTYYHYRSPGAEPYIIWSSANSGGAELTPPRCCSQISYIDSPEQRVNRRHVRVMICNLWWAADS